MRLACAAHSCCSQHDTDLDAKPDFTGAGGGGGDTGTHLLAFGLLTCQVNFRPLPPLRKNTPCHTGSPPPPARVVD